VADAPVLGIVANSTKSTATPAPFASIGVGNGSTSLRAGAPTWGCD
jgi:hypothetical protein